MIRVESPRVCLEGAAKERQKLHGRATAGHGIPDDPTPVRVTGKPWKALTAEAGALASPTQVSLDNPPGH